MDRVRILASAFAILVVAWAAPGFAVDGVIEINQAAVFAGGITPGDSAGFPATLSLPGSYRLTGNLDVTKMQNGNPQPSPENVTAIEVMARDVTIDLNGFEILGPVTCTPIPPACMPASGTGNGVSSSQSNTAVVNGTIRGMGSVGVAVGSDGGRVEAVRAISNGFFGIVATNGAIVRCIAQTNGGGGIQGVGSVVTGNHSRQNLGRGIFAGEATVSGNTANSNGSAGIEVTDSVVLGNVASGNGGVGLNGDAATGYGNNVFNNNNSGGAQVSGGPNQIPTGSNVCGGDTVCP